MRQKNLSIGSIATEPPFIRRPKHSKRHLNVPNSPLINIKDVRTFPRKSEVEWPPAAALPKQAMQPRSQFSSGHSARKLTNSVRRAQPPKPGQVTKESIQSRQFSQRSPAVRIDELFPTFHMDELYPTVRIDKLFPAVHMDELYPTVRIDKPIYSAQTTVPQESEQLRLHCHSGTSALSWNATKAIAPGAQQLTLTSPSTLHRPRCLRSQNSSGYIATRLERHQGHNARSPVAHFDEPIYSA